GILTTIGLGKDNEKDKEKDNQKDGTSGGSSTKPDSAKPAEVKAKANDKSSGQKDSKKPAASQAQDSASEESSFPVESIDAVSDGVSKMSQAMQQFTANNAKLADLYQQVSQTSAVLAVARAVGDQVASYAASL